VLVREMLRSSWPGDFAFEHFDRIAAARDHLLVEGASCILLDLSLPDAHGLEAVDRVQTFAPDVPIGPRSHSPTTPFTTRSPGYPTGPCSSTGSSSRLPAPAGASRRWLSCSWTSTASS
jgi:hypothetical protein